MSNQGWGQGFTYDGFGNLTGKTVLAGSVPTFSAAFDPATNRQAGISYDANGNQLTDRSNAASLGTTWRTGWRGGGTDGRVRGWGTATELSDIRVLFDGVVAPVLYVSAGQANAVAPYAVAGRGSTQVMVESYGQTSMPVTLPVVVANPGLFTANASGRGRGRF